MAAERVLAHLTNETGFTDTGVADTYQLERASCFVNLRTKQIVKL